MVSLLGYPDMSEVSEYPDEPYQNQWRSKDFERDGPDRDAYFAPGNDHLWGDGEWVKCYEPRCRDDRGLPSFHHRLFHDA
jgi:hypothetical protein